MPLWNFQQRLLDFRERSWESWLELFFRRCQRTSTSESLYVSWMLSEPPGKTATSVNILGDGWIMISIVFKLPWKMWVSSLCWFLLRLRIMIRLSVSISKRKVEIMIVFYFGNVWLKIYISRLQNNFLLNFPKKKIINQLRNKIIF